MPPYSEYSEYTPLLAAAATALGGICLYSLASPKSSSSAGGDADDGAPGLVKSLFLFFYSCFIKPHNGDGRGTQQDALESFYGKQAGAYDSTRKLLLQGREDMLALVSAQLEARASAENGSKKRRIWVDVGGGTGYNIEAMSRFVDVPNFFSSIYLVDFSPSLCDVARRRFARLGWKNVKVVCEDARKFRLEDYEDDVSGEMTPSASSPSARGYFAPSRAQHGAADLVTMSYSLSMIPDYHSVIDSISSLLAPQGIFGAVDFYTQSSADFAFRNFTGGFVDRHVSFFTRSFWRSWFDLDRVSLDPGRRDYLEYKFGTLLGVNGRNKALGGIPYYIWLGVHKAPFSSSSLPHEIVEKIDALATESPRLYPSSGSGKKGEDALARAVEKSAPEIRSKAFVTAVQNLSANLPLPAFFYQNHHWRIHYDDQLKKHTQFNNEYIYAFTWEDARVDEHILKLGPEDVVLAITSAGDNILSYARQGVASIHAVDLNPTQNHLLELKVASYTALPYEDFWMIFGEGKHPRFRELLLTKLSPHLSSRAFQYWLSNVHVFSAKKSNRGLYDTGGSRHAIRVVRWIGRLFFCKSAIAAILESKTLNEQREIWRSRIRPALLSRLLCNLVVSQESFLWAALGVPKNQLAMIESDHAASEASAAEKAGRRAARKSRSRAVWRYMVDTLDPVAEDTHIAADNPYYYVCLAGQFSRRCHPDYLSPRTHTVLSRPGALEGLRIHTDELDEVIARMAPGTLTVAVVMDSMDWFEPGTRDAARQISRLNRALAMRGRVMLRSSALTPWYVKEFEALGFTAKRVGVRGDGVCVDRVNMYASCWVCTKVGNLPPPTPEMDGIAGADINELVL
ncbi:related to S-adenosylmethionine:diacylglycerol 3-amino-3-carboxypropyl transferase [Cephalotrichum gorgonifer]|uniref:Related to S-adenosylmethionine:diacylglycerol 3-amino-3-carboxypropyl transferase n=1 Tax=Cephalotrichum gorgonifer TaxID=2041049 RepID=A0AAE8MXD5_9PEZI|nr:related to S-adenosylmethionine:diacylglycerol 3-amino-3-carboxypropyl transferase [Cephalotrichum gorgonifer]